MDDRIKQDSERVAAILDLLQAFEINLDSVAARAGLQTRLVETALTTCHPESCPLMVLIRVQTAAEMLLREQGWSGNSEEIWCPFYRMLATAGDAPKTRSGPD